MCDIGDNASTGSIRALSDSVADSVTETRGPPRGSRDDLGGLRGPAQTRKPPRRAHPLKTDPNAPTQAAGARKRARFGAASRNSAKSLGLATSCATHPPSRATGVSARRGAQIRFPNGPATQPVVCARAHGATHPPSRTTANFARRGPAFRRAKRHVPCRMLWKGGPAARKG